MCCTNRKMNLLSRLVELIIITASLLQLACSRGIHPNSGLDLRIALRTNHIILGEPLVVEVSISNRTQAPLLTRSLNSPWQWLVVSDKDGVDVPSTVAGIIEPGIDTPISFVLLKPGERIAGVLKYQWVTDARLRQIIAPGIAPEVGILETVERYLQITAGVYDLAIQRRVFGDKNLKSNGRSIPIEDYFGARLVTGDFISNRLRLEVTPSALGGNGVTR